MSRSTGAFISYDLRPAKQTERLILVDVLKSASDSGIPISDYRYVGMGANRFYDFMLMHRYLGISNMISLEHDSNFYDRAKFNRPYSFIDVRNTSASDFIAADDRISPSIYWLDYDGGIASAIISDVNDYAEASKVGDFLFMTVSGNAPRVIDKANDVSRLAWLQDNLGAVSGDVLVEDVSRRTFPTAVHKILWAAFRQAFAPRTDGQFIPLLQVSYSDSMPMMTFGGAFLSETQSKSVVNKLSKSLPFIRWEACERYNIPSLHLTERERALFDIAVTSKRRNIQERNKLMNLGFGERDLKSYKEILRYLPRYVETMV